MLFHSIECFVFFPIVVILYFFLVHVVKKNLVNQLLLLTASLYFYACWEPKYLLIILTSVFITWISGILMMDRPQRYKKIVLFISLLSNLGILFFFKYYNFFVDTINILYTKLHIHTQIPAFNVLLPVGISFYTFQALGYSIDVYRGTVKAEKNIITYALFVTFFPQLVAGPIERTEHLLPQLKVNHDFDYDRVTNGLKLALWGMFKKIVIADQLAIYVDKVYSSPTEYQSAALILATVFFAFQILCDFSGYSDIAIGCAKVLGFSLNKNFESPYLARNMADFWKRWHISLSTWFRDYLYIPLGGNRCSPMRHYFNLLIVFLLSGLWHGASITFIFWGLIHGLFLIIGNIKNKVYEMPTRGITSVLQIMFTFICVCFAWVFFRANSLKDAFYIIASLKNAGSEIRALLYGLFTLQFNSGLFVAVSLGFSRRYIVLSVILIFVVICAEIIKQNKSVLWIESKYIVIRWIIYYTLSISILIKLLLSNYSVPFLYFQF